ncbi:hypothetical protein Tco_0854841 [Tanacetum coccineum]
MCAMFRLCLLSRAHSLVLYLCQSLKCVSSISSMTGKGCEYKYGGQRSYKRITTHSYLVMSFTQIDVHTVSAGRPAAESLGGGTGVRVGRGGRGRRPKEGNDERVDDLNGQGNDHGLRANRDNLLPAMLAQVGNQGNVGNQNGNVVTENVQENVGNVIVNGNWVGCSYKEFLACNPKEYDGKGGAVVLTRWIEKMEFVQDMSGCSVDQKVKYIIGSFVGKALTCHEMQKLESELWNHAIIGAGHAAYTDRFHKLARLVPYLVTP